jgi:hypothetical protein
MSTVHLIATFGECVGYEDIDRASYWNVSGYTDAYMLLLSVNKALSFIILSENETEIISKTVVPAYQTTQHHILGDSNLKDTKTYVA